VLISVQPLAVVAARAGRLVAAGGYEEHEDAYVLEAELPRVRRDDIDVELVGSEHAITGEAEHLGPAYGPMIVFAAASELRPGEWIALEDRDLDRDARVV
jgi:hypothetical protein